MEDRSELNVNTTTFVIFLIILSGLGILWVVSCSWLTGRKKRQRVGNNSNADSLVLEVASPMSSAKGKPSGRFSATEQIIILPIDDFGQSLRVPTIVVTPPSPLSMFAEVTSIQSNGSIGSANDLIQSENNVEELEEFQGRTERHDILERGFDRGSHIRDSMRNTLGDFDSVHSIESEETVTVREFSDLQQTPSSCDSPAHCNAVHRIGDTCTNKRCDNIDAASSCRENTQEPPLAFVPESNSNSDDDFDLEPCSPRPRLSSMEPGTKKANFQFSRLRRS